MLARQSWRVLKEPDALWVTILKGIYFRGCSFMEVSRGCHPSWIWNNWIARRNVIKEHGAWSVGNGKSVEGWRDKWIPGLTDMKLQCEEIPQQVGVLKVADHHREQSKWNTEPVVELISEEERAIRTVYIGEED